MDEDFVKKIPSLNMEYFVEYFCKRNKKEKELW
jgi:hypothetical protein